MAAEEDSDLKKVKTLKNGGRQVGLIRVFERNMRICVNL